MDILDLPIVNGSDSLEVAFLRMKASNARAIVVSLERAGHCLIMNRELVNAHGEGVERLADITYAGRELVRITTRQERWERELDRAGALFGLVPATGPLVRVVTRHETLAAQIRLAPKVCMCSKNPKHLADSPPAAEGGKCEYGDGYYECY